MRIKNQINTNFNASVILFQAFYPTLDHEAALPILVTDVNLKCLYRRLDKPYPATNLLKKKTLVRLSTWHPILCFSTLQVTSPEGAVVAQYQYEHNWCIGAEMYQNPRNSSPNPETTQHSLSGPRTDLFFNKSSYTFTFRYIVAIYLAK